MLLISCRSRLCHACLFLVRGLIHILPRYIHYKSVLGLSHSPVMNEVKFADDGDDATAEKEDSSDDEDLPDVNVAAVASTSGTPATAVKGKAHAD